MLREEEQALRQGGQALKLRQQLDSLYDQLRDQQVEMDQQLQQILGQENTCLNSSQTLKEAEALLQQLKSQLTPEGRGLAGVPFRQAQELLGDLVTKLQQEEGTAREELQKSLHQAASSLLQGLEATRNLNKLGHLKEQADQSRQMVGMMADREAGGKGLTPDVGSH